MGILEVNELRAGIRKYCVNMEHPSDMVIKVSSGLTVCLSL